MLVRSVTFHNNKSNINKMADIKERSKFLPDFDLINVIEVNFLVPISTASKDTCSKFQLVEVHLPMSVCLKQNVMC